MKKRKLENFYIYLLTILILISLVYGVDSLRKILDFSGKCFLTESSYLKVRSVNDGQFDVEVIDNKTSFSSFIKMKRSEISQFHQTDCF